MLFLQRSGLLTCLCVALVELLPILLVYASVGGPVIYPTESTTLL